MTFQHTPVLLKEVVSLFKEHAPARIVDGTVGGAGHASAILEALPDASLLGIDQDSDALQAAQLKLAKFGARATTIHGNFKDIAALIRENGWENVDAVLLDLGVSSHQIDTPERGFSLRFDAPLDMRMDKTKSLTAQHILNTYTEQQLADIFFNYGEEHKARQVARAVVLQREKRPWETTGQFAELLERIIGRAHQHGLPPATRCFQALRIAVNNELDVLKTALQAALSILSPGGLLVVISFHSLEDRIVKQFFNYEELKCICPPDFPVCRCNKKQTLKILTHKPITPTEEEIKNNPRSACSKLRAAVKL